MRIQTSLTPEQERLLQIMQENAHIVFADDSLVNTKIARKLFEKMGLSHDIPYRDDQVAEAGEIAISAYEEATKKMPDKILVVITDYDMPTNGKEVIDAVMSNNPNQNALCLLCSSESRLEELPLEEYSEVLRYPVIDSECQGKLGLRPAEIERIIAIVGPKVEELQRERSFVSCITPASGVGANVDTESPKQKCWDIDPTHQVVPFKGSFSEAKSQKPSKCCLVM